MTYSKVGRTPGQ